MPRSIDIRIVGDAQGVERMLRHLEEKLSPAHMGGFLNDKVDEYLRVRARNRFKSEGDDVVGKWAPLAQATQDIRASQGFGPSHPINHRTGQLENYITEGPNKLTVDPAGAILTFPGGNPSGIMGEKISVAQSGNGGNKSSRPIPARPVLGVNEQDILTFLTMLAHDLEDQS